MLFLVHDDDGRITQANKVYVPDGYADQLNEHNYKFISLDREDIIPIGDFYIKSGNLVRRPIMPLRMSRDRITAGESDATIIRGIPRGAWMTIALEGHEAVPLLNDIINDTALEFSAPAPGTYKITFEKFPYLVRTIKVYAQ